MLGMARQVLAALHFGLRSHVSRPRHAMLMIAGFAIAAVTVTFMLAIPAGLQRLAGATGRSDLAIVLQADARSEIGSSLSHSVVDIVRNLPGIARDHRGQPQVAPQYLASAQLRARDGTPITTQLRGITAATWRLLGKDGANTVPGQFNPDTQQLLAGQDIARILPAARSGAQLKIRDDLWQVAGLFVPGGLWNSELWSGLSVLQSAFNAPHAISVLWVKLVSPDALPQIAAAIDQDKRLYGVRVQSQRAYYAARVRVLSHYARLAALAVAVFLGLGAIIAIGNAISLALHGRRKELATLRALGFGDLSLALALFLEILLFAIGTGILVLAAMHWLAPGMRLATSTGDHAFGFQVAITLPVVIWVLIYTAVLGLASAVLPSLLVLRAPLTHALARD